MTTKDRRSPLKNGECDPVKPDIKPMNPSPLRSLTHPSAVPSLRSARVIGRPFGGRLNSTLRRGMEIGMQKPPHVHVDRDDQSAKFWLTPVALARNLCFSPPGDPAAKITPAPPHHYRTVVAATSAWERPLPSPDFANAVREKRFPRPDLTNPSPETHFPPLDFRNPALKNGFHHRRGSCQ